MEDIVAYLYIRDDEGVQLVSLVVEKSEVGVCQYDLVFIARVNNLFVVVRP